MFRDSVVRILYFRGIFHADFPRIFNNEEMPQSNDRIYLWKQRFGKKFWWKTSTKSCKKSCKVMQFYWSERIRTPLFLGSSVRQNFNPTFVATLQGSSLSAGRFQKGQIQESSRKSGSIFTKFNGTPCIWAVMGNVKKKNKKRTRYWGIRVSCLTLRDVVLIRC